ncbi:hypothetical protein [Aeromonas sp. 601027]|uniref:hypothetical protein n=1 Tax=unclassified Aeromonas TaxID=257493 RepID=UPI003A1C8FC7
MSNTLDWANSRQWTVRYKEFPYPTTFGPVRPLTKLSANHLITPKKTAFETQHPAKDQ